MRLRQLRDSSGCRALARPCQSKFEKLPLLFAGTPYRIRLLTVAAAIILSYTSLRPNTMAPTKHHGMAKNKVLQAKPVVAKPHKFHMDLQDPLECPLCIEQLDNTDRDFFPCPCGYQVCLFCYQRLQNEYNNTCPGCRQQYGEDLDAVRQHIECKQKQQALEATSRPAVCSSSSHTALGHYHGHLEYGTVAGSLGQHHGQHHAAHGHATHSGCGHAGHRPKTMVPPPPAAARPRQHLEPAPHPRPGELQGTGLPPNANWVNAAAAAGNISSVDSTDTSPPLPQPTADDDSWPSLGVAATTNNQQQQHKQQLVRRQSSSSSSETSMHSQQQQQMQQAPSSRHEASRSSMDSTVSSLTNHTDPQSSQQQDQRPQQQLESRSSSGFTAVEVTTVVGGARHSVCVPICNHSEVSPFPEAATLLEILQQAVDGNKLSSTEAAVQLVQCLRKLEADSSQQQQHAWLDHALVAARNGAVRTGTAAVAAAAIGGRAAAGKDMPPTVPSSTRAPPPGFANHPRANGVYSPHLRQQNLRQQQQGQAVDGGSTVAAATKSIPHRSVSSVEQQLAGRYGDNYASQSSMHSVDSDSSLFSQGSSLSQSAGLWTDAGLPGIDFSAGLGSGLRSNIPAVPPRLQMLWAGSNGTSNSQASGVTAAANSGYTAPSVPPGFAGSNSLGLSSQLGSSNTSRLLNGSYNPLPYADSGHKNSQQGTLAVPPGFGGLSGLAAQKQEQQLYRPWG